MQSVENKPLKKSLRQSAFSLVELLAVMVIISVLLVAAIPIFSNNSNSARESTREIIKGHLQQARAHAIASGTATAVAIPVLDSGTNLGARAISLFEVERINGNYFPMKDERGDERLLQRWEILPGNFHLLSSSQISSTQKTIVDDPNLLPTNYRGLSMNCHFIVFAPNGQIVRPASGETVNIATAQVGRKNNTVTLTQKVGDKPVFDFLQINRLTGRTRFLEP